MICPNCKKKIDEGVDYCYYCGETIDSDNEIQTEKETYDERIGEEREDVEYSIEITTGPNFEGYRIQNYYGIVSGSSVVGSGVFSDFKASFSDTFGSKSGAYEGKLDQVHIEATEELKEAAYKMGANAIIAISYHYVTFEGNMMGCIATGTAVKIEKI